MKAALLAVLCSTAAAAQVADVISFGAISRDGAVRLRWTNPGEHSGVLILRATEPIAAAPVDGVAYAQGAALGNATVAYADSASTVSVFDDAGRTNGIRYHYRIHNLNNALEYSGGNVPSSSGLTSTPTPGTGTAARWCYAMGSSAVMQPVVETGVGVFFAGNTGTINASITAAGQANDGDERWRPLVLGGSVQGRFPVVTLYQGATRSILTGDSSGHAYAVNASTGALVWTGLGGAALGDAILAQPALQLRAYANAAFITAHPARDLIFFATRNASATNNKVYALDGNTGLEVWSYAPGDLDVINGGMFVDYVGNRLFVASRSNGGTEESLRVLDSLNGARLDGFALGDIDTGVVRNPTSNQALVVNAAGTVYGLGLTDLTISFEASVGAASSWAFPVNSGFILSLTSGAVERWSITGSVATRMWTTPVADPTGVNLEYTAQVAYVGSTDGKLHQLSLATGADQLQVDLGDDGVGTPSIDTTAMRLHVGTLGGHVCALPLPL